MEILDKLISFTFEILIVTYGVVFYFILRHLHLRNKKMELKFHENLMIGFQNNTITELEDVYIIYNGLKRSQISSGDYRLNRLMTTFITKLYSNEFNLDSSEVSKYIISAKELLQKNKDHQPFSDLPDQEKNIFNDLLSFIQNTDNESAIRKLKELGILVGKQKMHFDKLEKQNKWSIPLAIIGLILTILFGVVSVV